MLNKIQRALRNAWLQVTFLGGTDDEINAALLQELADAIELCEAKQSSTEELAPACVHGAMRVWWMPRRFGASFHVTVLNVADASRVLAILSRYDAFLLEPDHASHGGLEVSVDGEWSEWFDDDGHDIHETAQVT